MTHSICLLWQTGNILRYSTTYPRLNDSNGQFDIQFRGQSFRVGQVLTMCSMSGIQMHRKTQEKVISFLLINWKCSGLRIRNWIIRVDRCRRIPRSENRDLNKHARSHISYAYGTRNQNILFFFFSFFFKNAICLSSCFMGAARFTVYPTTHSI